MSKECLEFIKEKLKNSYDVIYREIQTDNGLIYIVFIDGLSDSEAMSRYVITPLMTGDILGKTVEDIKKEILTHNKVGDVKSKEDALLHILSSDAVILFEFSEHVLFCETKSNVKRAIDIPITETVIKGPRAGFTENISDNICLLRRYLKTPDLKLEVIDFETKSNQTVAMGYIEGIADPNVVDYLRSNLQNIKTDFLMSSNFIEERLKSKHTFFDTIGYTEKPDIAAHKVAEGRVAILVDGTPFIITAPHFFVENFQTGDDYYLNKYVSWFGRALRIIAFLISLLLPGFYVALGCYHFNLIPSVMAFRLAVTRSGIPYPTIVEVIVMLSFFTILREAGIRLSQPIGSALNIVGALILGEAAVGASLASEVTVIIIAVSAICSFMIPTLYGGLIASTLFILIFASLLGLPGFYIGFILVCSHIAGLTTCGYPYMYPLGTLNVFKFRDVFMRGDLDRISAKVLRKEKDR